MKTQEELQTLKFQVEELNKKLAELTDEELSQVSGGLFLLVGSRVVEADAISFIVGPETTFSD